METYRFTFQAKGAAPRQAHVGVVGSGDLEVLIEPAPDQLAQISVRTSVDGYGQVWKNVVERFVAQHAPGPSLIEINDFGATPAMVMLRLQQALEESAP